MGNSTEDTTSREVIQKERAAFVKGADWFRRHGIWECDTFHASVESAALKEYPDPPREVVTRDGRRYRRVSDCIEYFNPTREIWVQSGQYTIDELRLLASLLDPQEPSHG